ncbi:MAG: gephyrin-like molybdotransferase Glp [Nitrospirota bacterium]
MRTKTTLAPSPVRESVSFQEALELILDAAMPLGPVEKRWNEALGDVLAEDMVSSEPSPAFDQSSVDGYAVRAESVGAASADQPVTLAVIDEVAAGTVPQRALAPGTAIRVMTGAAIPSGADGVVPIEQANEQGPVTVAILAPAKSGDHIRRAGEDIRPGMRLLQAGTRLTPARLGLLALLGRTTVKVHRKPSVAILSTGNELADVGGPLSLGKVRNVNSAMLGALVSELGCPAADLGLVRDDLPAICSKLAAGLSHDVVITSGGVSVGRHDHMLEAMQHCGVELLFWRVRIKPGMPLVVGRSGRTLWFGLPGNPVSALVNFVQFVKPALLKMMGARSPLERVVVPAVLEQMIFKDDRKRHFHRVVVERGPDGFRARSSGRQGSHMMASLARANGLVAIPEESAGFPAGRVVDVELL